MEVKKLHLSKGDKKLRFSGWGSLMQNQVYHPPGGWSSVGSCGEGRLPRAGRSGMWGARRRNVRNAGARIHILAVGGRQGISEPLTYQPTFSLGERMDSV